ncbi:MAG: hypothetical protein DRJ36_03915 [Thermoprotei archaeon]|nr:MAG: hypothetical protein DRJ36_03915 [Thermoprotei archaeon]
MKVKIIGGKVYLPKKLREKAGLKDECEVILIGDQIILRAKVPEKLNALKVLKEVKVEASIDDMVKAEEVENV